MSNVYIGVTSTLGTAVQATWAKGSDVFIRQRSIAMIDLSLGRVES